MGNQFEHDMHAALQDVERAMAAEGIAFTAENVAAECRRRGFPDHTAGALSALVRAILDERRRAGGAA